MAERATVTANTTNILVFVCARAVRLCALYRNNVNECTFNQVIHVIHNSQVPLFFLLLLLLCHFSSQPYWLVYFRCSFHTFSSPIHAVGSFEKCLDSLWSAFICYILNDKRETRRTQTTKEWQKEMCWSRAMEMCTAPPHTHTHVYSWDIRRHLVSSVSGRHKNFHRKYERKKIYIHI